MASIIDRIKSDLLEAINASQRKTSAYDTEAEIVRVEGNTAWVHIAGGVSETPVAMTINARKGDKVQVRIANDGAWIMGNATAPPTDDRKAEEAKQEIADTNIIVKTVKTIAEQAQKIAGNTNQYFWHTQEGTDTGAHITEIPQEEFLADPSNGGGNLLARSTGIAIRNGLTEVAQFGNEVIVGVNNGTQSYLEIDYHSIQFKDSEGETYFWVSDAKDAEGYLTETFEGDGTTTEFNLQNGLRNDHSFVVKINGVETTAFSHIGVSPKFVFNTAPLAGDVITIKYLPSWYNSSPTYTFGKRKSGSNNGIWSVVEGTNTVASGACSHAEGTNTVASGACSHAEGGNHTTASGNHSHAEGDYSVASGYGSHAEGFTAKAEGSYSHAQGYQTIATQKAQMVMGSYNVGDVSPSVAVHPSGDTSFGNYAVIVGNGTANNARSNALTVDWSGNVVVAGGLTLDGTNAVADYVVEQGTSGIWTYRKWNSGIAECWGTYSWTITGWIQWGNVYESSSSYASYPSSLFVSAPTLNASNLPSSNGEATLAVEMNQTLASETRTPTLYLIRGTNGTANVTGYVSIHAYGTWK